MLETLQQIDVSLFYVINQGLKTNFFDQTMPIITEFKNWLPIYIFFSGYLLYKHKQKGLAVLIVLILTIVISDQIGGLIKDVVSRLRPCWQFDNINLLIPCGKGKSFPSNHAINNFGAAIVLSYYFRKYTYIFYTIAIIVSLSRIFVGVHFPFDVLSGAILGSTIGGWVILCTKYFKKIFGSEFFDATFLNSSESLTQN